MGKDQKPSLRAQWLGQQLNELREAAGKTLKEAGEYLQRNPSLVSRFESAEYPIRRPDLLALLDLYGISDQYQRERLLALSEEVWRKGWWDGYAKDVAGWLVDLAWLENRAEKIQAFDVVTVNGLLQTQQYAEALIRAGDPRASMSQIGRWVDLRMTRQQILDRAEPPHITAILDESMLRRTVGGSSVLRAQLEYLGECAARPNIELRILPFGAGAHASQRGGFSILTMPDPFPEVAYVESPAGAICLEAPDSDRFLQTYDWLWEATLGPEESTELISAAIEEL